MPVTEHIHILKDAVARKIAAGEVIERPQSVVRELLDNSLDASAASIDLHLESGGNDLIRVTDNGFGMGREDLEKCYLPHATSKITSADDLLRLKTLGFRGEALSSMAAVSRLTVTSMPSTAAADPNAATAMSEPSQALPHRIEVHGGQLVRIGPAAGSMGTTVEVAGLFFNLPARKKFLKRAQTESGLVRTVLVDRAIAFPEVEFRLFSGSDLRLYLPAADRTRRITSAYPERTEPALLHSLTGSGDGFSLEIVAAEPTAPRKDRKQVQIFVNRRRIWEYALVQAIEYSYRDYLYGGQYPVAYLFLEVEPELVDFNIHPAKREARFRNLPEIHRRIVDVLTSYLRVFGRASGSPPLGAEGPLLAKIGTVSQTESVADSSWGRSSLNGSTSNAPPASGQISTDRWESVCRRTLTNQGASYDLSRALELPDESGLGFTYLGQLFGLFLVVERSNKLYLVDQHAAHERIIYDRLRNGSASQELLFPVQFGVDEDKGPLLQDQIEDLHKLGIEIRQMGPETWELLSLPASVEMVAEELIDLIRDLAARPADFSRELYAAMSCRAAVMDGDIISRATAIRILSDVLDLVNARCPHGRPIWAEFTEEELMKIVGRT